MKIFTIIVNELSPTELKTNVDSQMLADKTEFWAKVSMEWGEFIANKIIPTFKGAEIFSLVTGDLPFISVDLVEGVIISSIKHYGLYSPDTLALIHAKTAETLTLIEGYTQELKKIEVINTYGKKKEEDRKNLN